MHVGSYQLIGSPEVHPNKWSDPTKSAYFMNQMKINKNMSFENNSEVKRFVVEAILANTDVRMEVDEGDSGSGTANYVAMGQALEVAMINFLMENG